MTITTEAPTKNEQTTDLLILLLIFGEKKYSRKFRCHEG